MCRGIFYFTIICFDPAFRQIICCKKKDINSQVNHKNAFLCSSLNLELVSAILKGV